MGEDEKGFAKIYGRLMDPNIITIRPYNLQDYRGMVEILKEAGLYEETMDTERVYRNKITANPQSILVAIKNGEVIGCVVALTEWGPLVFRLAVKKESQDKGLGSTLLTEAEEYLRKQYHSEVHVLVNEQDRDLKKWYEKHGYRAGNLYRWYYKKI